MAHNARASMGAVETRKQKSRQDNMSRIHVLRQLTERQPQAPTPQLISLIACSIELRVVGGGNFVSGCTRSSLDQARYITFLFGH